MKSFDNLFAELENRLAEPVAGSGTSELLEAGVHAIGKKLVEEAAELWMAAEHESDQQVPNNEYKST
jgi:phosphoribosyl-ATP pyrophosphohydrolase